MKKEYVMMQETLIDTQKKIRTWVSSGYEVEIVSQHLVGEPGYYQFVTSL